MDRYFKPTGNAFPVEVLALDIDKCEFYATAYPRGEGPVALDAVPIRMVMSTPAPVPLMMCNRYAGLVDAPLIGFAYHEYDKPDRVFMYFRRINLN